MYKFELVVKIFTYLVLPYLPIQSQSINLSNPDVAYMSSVNLHPCLISFNIHLFIQVIF
jgi:hypothetical protein